MATYLYRTCFPLAIYILYKERGGALRGGAGRGGAGRGGANCESSCCGAGLAAGQDMDVALIHKWSGISYHT